MSSRVGCGRFGRFGGVRLGICLGSSRRSGYGRRLQGGRGARRMLEIFAMLSDERWAKLRQFFAKLGNYFGANQVLDRLFGRRV